jgi:hypothetical protein
MNKIIHWFLIFILVATSGFQYFYGNIEWIVIGLVAVLSFVFYNNRKVFLNYKAFAVISLFLIWEIIQFAYFGGFSVASIGGTMARFLLSYFVIVILDKQFIPLFIDFIALFSAISLVFFLLMHIQPILDGVLNLASTVFSPPFGETMEEYSHNTNIIIFNFHGYEFSPKRNSGPFWEPGAFAVYICLSLSFSLIIGRSLLSFPSLIQILALMTTFSTSGYVIFFFIVLTGLYAKVKQVGSGIRLVMRSLFFPLIIFTLLMLVQGQDFLLPKIQEDILIADETTTSRFGSALADIYQIQQHPILGYGRNFLAQFGTAFFDKETMHRNSGVTRIVVQWGILSLLYYILVFRGFRNIINVYSSSDKYSPIFLFIVLILSGFSQSIFQYSFFMGLIFLQIIGKQHEHSEFEENQLESFEVKYSHTNV